MDVFEFRKKADSACDAETEELAHAIIGAAIEVHRILGPGLPEAIYQRALSHELDLRRIAHVCESPLPVEYKGKLVGEGRLDLLVAGKVIVELKSVESLSPVHRAQAVSYLQATGLQLALLINFNVALLKDGIKRIINTRGARPA